MQGYYGDDMDEYEDDGFIEHVEEQVEYEEDGEEEVRKPTKEELDYLETRQQLKERIRMRKQMEEENGAAAGNSHERKKLPYDNYGSFFGPSQPVIAQRVIQESKLLLENQRLAAARVSNSRPASATTMSRPPKVVNVGKQKAQKLKESRDYSFLSCDDAELPAPSKEPPPKNVLVPNSDARSGHAPSKSPKAVSSSSRLVLNGKEQRTLDSTGHLMQRKVGQHKVAPGSRPPANPRKQLGSSAANGQGRSLGTKGLPSKMPVPTKTPTSNKTSMPNKVPASPMDKRASGVGVKRPVPGVLRAPLPKSHSSVPGVQKTPLSKSHSSEQRREIREPDRGRVMSKQSVSSSRPQIKPPKQNPSRDSMQNDRPNKRLARPFEDEDDDAMIELRRITGYNPNKYVGVYEDDSNMEANFRDIQKEEIRSAKIARLEDEREARLNDEEDRKREEAKRRKLSQR